MAVKALSVSDFLQALSGPEFREQFFTSEEEKRILNEYLEGDCVLCGLPTLVRIILSKRDKVLEVFGEEYAPWLDKLNKRR